MNDKIVSLSGGYAVAQQGEPVECVLKELEEMLAEARSGNLVGLGWIRVHKNMLVTAGWNHSGGSPVSNAITAGSVDLFYALGQARGED